MIRDVVPCFPVYFHVRINEVIQWLAGLARIKHQITAHGELHSVRIVRAEEIGLLARVLPGFGNIHGHPTIMRVIELSPAMVTGNLARLLAGGQWEADLEACGDTLR